MNSIISLLNPTTLGLFRLKFYPKGKKRIPSDIESLLKYLISLAVWYMDDGNLDKRYKYHCNATLATYDFTFGEYKKLTKVLKKNFGIFSSVNRNTMRGKVYPRLYIRSKSMDRFISIIKPFINPVFKYKIGLI